MTFMKGDRESNTKLNGKVVIRESRLRQGGAGTEPALKGVAYKYPYETGQRKLKPTLNIFFIHDT